MVRERIGGRCSPHCSRRQIAVMRLTDKGLEKGVLGICMEGAESAGEMR